MISPWPFVSCPVCSINKQMHTHIHMYRSRGHLISRLTPSQLEVVTLCVPSLTTGKTNPATNLRTPALCRTAVGFHNINKQIQMETHITIYIYIQYILYSVTITKPQALLLSRLSLLWYQQTQQQCIQQQWQLCLEGSMHWGHDQWIISDHFQKP